MNKPIPDLWEISSSKKRTIQQQARHLLPHGRTLSMIPTNEIKPGMIIVYNDGRKGHSGIPCKVLETHPQHMIVQFLDRADTTTIGFNEAAWMDYLQFVDKVHEHSGCFSVDIGAHWIEVSGEGYEADRQMAYLLAAAPDLLKLATEIHNRIACFQAECERESYTDSGAVHELLAWIDSRLTDAANKATAPAKHGGPTVRLQSRLE